MSTCQPSACNSPAGLLDMPPGIITTILAAAHPDEGATAAALSATCRCLRRCVLSSRTSAELQRFGRSQRIAPLLQRLSGLHSVSLAGCAGDAIPWLELKQLQHLRKLTLPLAHVTALMQPLGTLQQLTALLLTSCEYGAASELPATAIMALTRLVVLDTADCAPLAAAGLHRLSTLQRLEVLRVPCDSAHAVTHLAAQLPRLRSLDLRCCSAEALPAGPGQQLSLAPAAALTGLRLRIGTAGACAVQRLKLPRQLQVLHLDVMVKATNTADSVVDMINSVPLQHLASLAVLDTPELWPSSPPLGRVRLPRALPRLQQLLVAGYAAWDNFHALLWPLVILAAQGAQHASGSEQNAGPQAQAPKCPSGDGWRFTVCVRERLTYHLTAADILQPRMLEGDRAVDAAMRGRLVSAEFDEPDYSLRTLRWGESEEDVLRGLLQHDTGLTQLVLQSDGDYEGNLQVVQLGGLTALRHLQAHGLAPLTSSDCAALKQLRLLTSLHLPRCGMASLAAVGGCLSTLTDLQHVTVRLALTPDVLLALRPLRALKQLSLGVHSREDSPPCLPHGWHRPHSWDSVKELQLPLRQLEIVWDVDDLMLAAALQCLPCLQELDISSNKTLNGSGLEELPRCCPFLRTLRLMDLPQLTGCFLPAVQQLTDLAALELCARGVVTMPLATGLPLVVAANIPPNLQTLRLQYSGKGKLPPVPGATARLAEFLAMLPGSGAPLQLRFLDLSRGDDKPLTGDDLASLSAAKQQLAHLERLDLSNVQVGSGAWQHMLALPALVQLNTSPFCCDLEFFGDHATVVQRTETLTAEVAAVSALFRSNQRTLVTGVTC